MVLIQQIFMRCTLSTLKAESEVPCYSLCVVNDALLLSINVRVDYVFEYVV